MSRLVVLLFLVVAVFSVYAYPPEPQTCGPNEEWTSCGSNCDQECNKPPKLICPTICIARCQCQKGFMRNAANHCVSPQNCN